jgi:hypothetical protein
MEMSGRLHDPVALHSREGSSVPFAKDLGGPQSQSGRCGIEKSYPSQESNLGPLALSQTLFHQLRVLSRVGVAAPLIRLFWIG